MGHQKRCHNQNTAWIWPPKWTQNPSSKAAQSAAQDVMNDEDTCKQNNQDMPYLPGHLLELRTGLKRNPVDCQKLFSDSTKNAKDEGSMKNMFSKGTKSEFHKMIVMFCLLCRC